MKFQKFLIFHLWVCVMDLPRWSSAFQAWLPAKLKSPHFKHKSRGFRLG